MSRISDLSQEFLNSIDNILLGNSIDPLFLLELYNYAQNQFFETNPGIITSNWNWNTSTVNGKDVVGNLLPLVNTSTIVDQVIDGKRLVANLGTRKAGTRVGVHVHQSGGATFVIAGKGAITDSVEGYADTYNPLGNYYFMPYNTPMSAANLSEDDVVLLDVFFFPVDQTAITILEPDYPSYDPPQHFYDAVFVEPSFIEQIVNSNNLDIKGKQFEGLGNIKNMRSTNINFDSIQDSSLINSSLTTVDSGNLESNSLFLSQAKELNGIYFNSASGNDKIIGSLFNDFIRGGSGNDFIKSLDGKDIIRGGSGADVIYGGGGADTFLYTFDQIDNSVDQIKDFDQTSGNMLVIQDGIDVVIDQNSIFLTYSGFKVKVEIGNDSNSSDIIAYGD
jgi:Ca2+-binding RTX toxin-like protein